MKKAVSPRREYYKKYCEENREWQIDVAREYQNKHYKKNSNKIRERNLKYYYENREEILKKSKEKQAEYRKKNRQTLMMQARARRKRDKWIKEIITGTYDIENYDGS